MNQSLVSQVVQRPGSAGESLAIKPCATCKIIAEFIRARENIGQQWVLKMEEELGTWQAFRERQQCACCSAIVSCIDNMKGYTDKWEPSYTIKLVSNDYYFEILPVRLAPALGDSRWT